MQVVICNAINSCIQLVFALLSPILLSKNYKCYVLQEIWYRQLTDKVKNEVRNEKYDPLVLSRKRKNANGSDRSPKVSASLLRGIVNWEPPAIDGEDEHSSRAHIAWMKKEKKKKNFSNALVSKKMELTFAYRRKMINKGDLSLRSIKEEFPFLFELDQVRFFIKHIPYF